MRVVTKRQRGWPLTGEFEARLAGNRDGSRIAGDTFPGDLGGVKFTGGPVRHGNDSLGPQPFSAVRRTEPKTKVTELPAPPDNADERTLLAGA